MARVDGQNVLDVLQTSASLAISGCTSGSVECGGYAKIVGGIIANASSIAGSGLRFLQSYDGGNNWDHITACQISACTSASFSLDVIGDAVKVEYRNAGTAASLVRAVFWLRPV